MAAADGRSGGDLEQLGTTVVHGSGQGLANISVGARGSRTHNPAYGGWGSGGRDQSWIAASAAMPAFGSPGWICQDLIQVQPYGDAVACSAQAAFIAAPSMTTPLRTNLHSATTSWTMLRNPA